MFRCLLPLLCAAVCAAQGTYELSGRYLPAARGSVTLYGATSPFSASTLTEDGRFSFKKLNPGAYTIAVFLPDRGEVRRTVDVGPGNADKRGRVNLTLTFADAEFEYREVLRQRASVSAKQLAISAKAQREYELAQRDLGKRNVESAERRLLNAVELSPQFAAAWNNLGTIAYQTGRFPLAAERFREALKQDPDSYMPLVNLGGVLINLGDMDGAWKYNVHAVALRPNDPLANSQLGMTYFHLDRPDLAEKYLREAVRLDPGHFSHPQLFLAEIHVRRGDKKAAADDLESFLAHHPDWKYAEKVRATIADFRK
jgi:tetratricopeptide (TPR) repeat protein